jgi:hypothetical protein
VTEYDQQQRCRWCSRPLEQREGPGRKRQFCKQSCRQADYVARQRASEAGLTEHELIVTRQALEELRDKLYVLEAAVEDVERDRASANTAQELEEQLEWLLEAARPLKGQAALQA